MFYKILICDEPTCKSVEIFEVTESQERVLKNARTSGWSIGKKQICPKCKEKGTTA